MAKNSPAPRKISSIIEAAAVLQQWGSDCDSGTFFQTLDVRLLTNITQYLTDRIIPPADNKLKTPTNNNKKKASTTSKSQPSQQVQEITFFPPPVIENIVKIWRIWRKMQHCMAWKGFQDVVVNIDLTSPFFHADGFEVFAYLLSRYG
jgi:p-aminobenzoyl-glutamate transporter AbgT